jgi:hypothetical protein
VRIDLDCINAYKPPPRTKKVDVTPIRLEGDEDDEDGSDGGDEDEDEESTPVPHSKRHVSRCVFFASSRTSGSFYVYLYFRVTSALRQKTYHKVCSLEIEIPSKRFGQGAG